MKITFLGTSAGEEYPGIWCDCENCAKARAWGGKNIRRNSSVILDEDVMIDIGKLSLVQAERFGIDIFKLKTLLVTHSHRDHFNTHNLWARQMAPGYDKLSIAEKQKTAAPRFSSIPPLNMFGNERVAKALLNDGIDYNNPWAQIQFNLAAPFQKYLAENLEIYTLDGNHDDGGIHSINYIITRKNRTFLYLSDTGYPFYETLEIIKNYKYDFIITEGTAGFGDDSGAHMGFCTNMRLLEYFNANKLWKDKPDYYVTHVAPHWCPPHDEYSPVLAEKGLSLAYDGLVLEYPYN
jgi:phosphoribosyl 1,2-cyclic phosphate phosphodiesterase